MKKKKILPIILLLALLVSAALVPLAARLLDVSGGTSTPGDSSGSGTPSVTVCKHAYTNGVCTKCGEACAHSINGGTYSCVICGQACTHHFNSFTQTCVDCGFKCAHDYSNAASPATCTVCSHTCENHQLGLAYYLASPLSATEHFIISPCWTCGYIFSIDMQACVANGSGVCYSCGRGMS